MNVDQHSYKNEKSLVVKLDRSTSKSSDDKSEEVFLTNYIDDIEEKYLLFVENCEKIEQEIDISLAQQFIFLFSNDLSLSFEPIINSNFINSIVTKLLSSQIPDDIVVLLRSLKILFSITYLPTDYLIDNVIPFLILATKTSNIEIVELSLDCLLLLSNDNIMNRFLIRNYNQEGKQQANDYIQNLWDVLYNFLPNGQNTISIHICQTIIQIFTSFYSNVELDMIKLVFDKLIQIVLNSYNYSFLALEGIEKFSNFSANSLKAIAECQGILSIQKFLLEIHSEYQMKKPEKVELINKYKKLSQNNSYVLEKIELFEQAKISISDFINSLSDNGYNDFYLTSFHHINQRMNSIVHAESITMNILFNFVNNSIFNDLDSSFLIKLFKEFDYKANNDLAINTLRFTTQAIKYHNPFRSLFFDDPCLFQLLLDFTYFSSYSIRVEAGHLVSQIIILANKSFISKLIECGIVGCTIQLIGEIQDLLLFKKLANAICKVIDLGFGKSFLNDLLEIIGSLNEMEESKQNEETVNCSIILRSKIQSLSELKEKENDE